MQTKFYVYIDRDHDEVELFTTLKKAKAHAEKMWPACLFDATDPNSEVYPVWEGGPKSWSWGEYVTIEEKKVKS